MTKKVYFKQNNGHLPPTPPHYLGTLASACWRKIVPFLESTGRVERIDVGLVEQYCANYEMYRNAYQDIQENGIQAKIFTSLQDSSGKIVGKDFVGFRERRPQPTQLGWSTARTVTEEPAGINANRQS